MIFALVTGGLLFAVLDMADPLTRVGYSLLGGAAAYLAVMHDPPKDRQETAARIATGVFFCFLFAPFLADRLGWTDLNGIVAVMGAVGLISWYVAGQVIRFGLWFENSATLVDLAKKKLGIAEKKGEDGKP